MSITDNSAAEARRHDPFGSAPVVEGAHFQSRPLDPLDVARHSAAAANEPYRRLQQRRAIEGEERFRYEEQIRRQRRESLERRRSRVQDREAMNRPQLRDAAVGTAGVLVPSMMIVSGSQVQGPMKTALFALAVAGSAVAGNQWMEWRCEQRTARYEDEMDRLDERIAELSVPRPRPFDAWGLDQG